MKRPVMACLVIMVLSFNAPLAAQESLLGRYSGTMGADNNKRIGIQLDIESVADGVVKGTATRFQNGACRGEYPVEGITDGDMLKLKATQKGGPLEDCNFKLDVKIEGSKLVGTGMKGRPVELSK
jgi:hypothetical protein